jgi:hypothetical protein
MPSDTRRHFSVCSSIFLDVEPQQGSSLRHMKLTMNLSRDSLVVDALRFDTKTVDAMVFD